MSASLAEKVVAPIKLAIGWASFYFVRFCERLLPPTVLSILLWPLAALWDLARVGVRKPWSHWQRFPQSWRPNRWRFLLRQSFGLYHSQLLFMWPDRLSSARWSSRCRFEGEENLNAASDGDRAIVLASLHFGPFEVLPYWLRAHGIAATSVRTRPSEALQSLADYQYSLSPPNNIPLFVFVEDLIPMPRFAHLRKILGPGRKLVVMLDPARGLQVDIPFEDKLFRMATGAVRLAQLADAILIPCLIAETATWRFLIHFGTPVPQNYLGKSPDMQAIGSHLLQEFSKVVTRYPDQCKMRCLRAMWPRSEGEVSDKSTIAQTAMAADEQVRP